MTIAERDTHVAPKRALLLAAVLRERIARGELAAGSSLPVEHVLMDEFEASRFVVREAMRVLEVEGLVEIRRGAGGGPRVRHPSIAVAAQVVGLQLQLHDVDLVDVWQTRTDLVLPAIASLARSRTGAMVDELDRLVARLDVAQWDPVLFPLVWVELTEHMVQLAANEARYLLVRALHQITEQQLAAATRAADPGQAAEFRAMVVASCARTVRWIADGDADQAVAEFGLQSEAKRQGMARLLGDATVVDVFPWRHPGDNGDHPGATAR